MAERTYRIHVAAELSGVRQELIRAWERRHQVLSPQRNAAGYRVYTDQDVALLRRLKQLTEEGVSISEAARLLPQLREELAQRESAPTPGANGDAGAEAWRRAVLAAAEAWDQARVSRILDEAFAALSPLRACADVLMPLQQEVGTRWEEGRLSIGQEHLVTQVVRARLVGLLHAAPSYGSARAVLACFPEEQHELGLLGAAVQLHHAGYRVTVLGQRTPLAELARVARHLGAQRVGLSCVHDPGAEAFTRTLEELRTLLPRGPETPQLWVGGRAAQRHAEACAAADVRLFRGADDWAQLAG
ncbi:MerR family transcriptional regulator [Aggregicoccus sp. 17bor-14]|uniref:MerR family transcriptional regulator n=1 Tax=Myxococcaceae TaxID=31 RepID=UPI00129CDDB8|nr:MULTISPECIES: MerR family transcriptional regulator [Myxococcaceae]MBF5042980.1 MerR family transcriptional regulator [Simulacricoccus sp. 17bor-14]MRI88746.1 MerR family transcriptional regulator [Aggregicoccus sp. 17bor-14]